MVCEQEEDHYAYLRKNGVVCNGRSELTYVTVIPLTLMLLQRPSGEQDRLATTAFSFPDDVPDMLPDMSISVHRAMAEKNDKRSAPVKPDILDIRV